MGSKKKATSGKYDVIIKSKGTGSRILEAGPGGTFRFESTSKGSAKGKLYTGIYWDTVEVTMQPDGTASFAGKFVQITNKGELLTGTGIGTQQPANSKGVAKFTGDGTMWSSSPRLSNLNGRRWTCEGEYDMNRETAEIRVAFYTSIAG